MPQDAIDLLYSGLRCGFAHHGFLKDDENYYNILLTNGLSAAMVYDDFVLRVVCSKYVAAIRKAFRDYCSEAKADQTLMAKFQATWEPDWRMSLRVPGGCGTVQSS